MSLRSERSYLEHKLYRQFAIVSTEDTSKELSNDEYLSIPLFDDVMRRKFMCRECGYIFESKVSRLCGYCRHCSGEVHCRDFHHGAPLTECSKCNGHLPLSTSSVAYLVDWTSCESTVVRGDNSSIISALCIKCGFRHQTTPHCLHERGHPECTTNLRRFIGNKRLCRGD
jgi:hypothetical protein